MPYHMVHDTKSTLTELFQRFEGEPIFLRRIFIISCFKIMLAISDDAVEISTTEFRRQIAMQVIEISRNATVAYRVKRGLILFAICDIIIVHC